jgi:ubiquinone/menaquinone biosynthesis C-methylase UbiE
MLQRLLEPEVMDTAEEAHDYDAMDHSQVNRVFVADFLARWHGDGLILDVGCGTAQIPIELCRQKTAVQVVGIDLAEHMLAVGRRNLADAGLDKRVTLQKVDAKAMPFAAGSFAAVVSNSIIHHIPEPRLALIEMVRVLEQGGTLFVRDLLRPASDEAVRQLVQLYAGDANAHQQKMFAESLGAALTLPEIRGLAAEVGLDPACVKQTTDRHWTLVSGK